MKRENENTFEVLSEAFTISSAGSFSAIQSLLHNEYCQFDGVNYDAQEKSITIPFSRIFHERGAIANSKWLPVKEVPVLRCNLVIRNVEETNLDSFAREGEMELMMCGIAYDAETRTITLDIGELFEIKVSEILIEYREQEYRGKIRMGSFGLFEWNSGIVNEWPG